MQYLFSCLSVEEDTFVGIIDLVEMKAEIYKDDLGKEYRNDRYS